MGKEERAENWLNYDLLFAQFKNLAVNRFKWTGLPKGLEERYIENALFNNGMCAFVNDPTLDFIALPCTGYNGLNCYNEYKEFNVWGGNYNEVFKAKDIVVIRNNPISMATHPYVDLYARRIAEIERTLDVNVSQQKHPYIIKCGENKVTTFKNIMKKVSEGELAVYGEKGLDMNTVEVFPTLAPFIGIEMMDYKNQVRNEFLTFLGINNSNTDKKERLVTDEVNSNNEVIQSNFEYMLFYRQKACEEINEKYGLNVKVEPRIIGGEKDGTVHTDNKGDSGE